MSSSWTSLGSGLYHYCRAGRAGTVVPDMIVMVTGRAGMAGMKAE